jgi:glyoxylate utilization-related uncharacterized protein
MATTFIDTNKIAPVQLPNGQGTCAEILNDALCGAKNVLGRLRWLDKGEKISAEPIKDKNQLIYLMEGEGVITLNDTDYDVKKGSGIYLAPTETATIRQTGTAKLKLFHLVVPRP